MVATGRKLGIAVSVECLEEAALYLKCSFVPFIPLYILAPNQFFFLFHEYTFQMIMGWCHDLAEAETAMLKILTLFIFASKSQMVLLFFSEHFKHIDVIIEMNLPQSDCNMIIHSICMRMLIS